MNHMHLRFTKHAKERMDERGISIKDVRETIERPNAIEQSLAHDGRFIAKRAYFNADLQAKHLLMVIYEQKRTETLVITIIDTSKIDKYY